MSSKQKAGHQARKRFGQNFLQDERIIERIINAIAPKEGDSLVEIGPGLGALTEPLLQKAGKLDVVEIDRDLIPVLKTQFFSFSGFNIHHGDALEFDFISLKQDKPLRLVGNLPYNISTPIIFHLLKQPDIILDMHFMLQKEVVDRITAEVGTKAYGRLSVIMQYHYQTEYLLTVPKGAFNPPPKVTSAVFRLLPFVNKPLIAEDEDKFAVVVRECFNHRRKTLRAIFKKNALLPTLDEAKLAELETLGIDMQARPETLTVADFVTLSNVV